MNPFPRALAISALLLGGVLTAQDKNLPVLRLDFVGDVIEFHVKSVPTEFLGGVIVSMSPDLTHYFAGLPPLLTDFAVLGLGPAVGGEFVVAIPQRIVPPGRMFYAQGIAIDKVGIGASDVVDFVLDGGAPAAPR